MRPNANYREIPVYFGDFGGRLRLPVPHGASVDVRQQLGVRHHGLLLQVTHEAVAELRADQIHDEKDVGEDSCNVATS